MKIVVLVYSLVFLLTGCSPIVVQIYTVSPLTNTIPDTPSSSQQFLSISYNFWEEKGNGYCRIFNESDSFITINLKESFFVYNGHATDYFTNVEVTSGKTVSTSYPNKYQVPFVISQYEVLTYSPESLLKLPPHSGSVLRLPVLSYSYLVDCNANDSGYVAYDSISSPISFRNIIAYHFESSTALQRITHAFYVSEIVEVNYMNFWNTYNAKECGEDKIPVQTITYSPFYGANRFYLVP